ncbi:MAG TPA: TIM barrel protein [Gaiellaceae bacterium]|nr:TIM barrel protein [Gaiellaceae bacterium]
MAYRIANAPVSYGAWSQEAARTPGVPAPARILDAVAEAGYAGTELGPPGLLGDARTLRPSLEGRGLALAGGYVAVPFGAGREAELAALDEVLDLFDAAAPDARPILADDGDPAAPLDHADVARAAEHARNRGYEPTFHHHMGTRVETAPQIEALLEAVDVPLLLDTGHLLAAGANPVERLRAWRARIDYVHVKDVDLGVLWAAPDWPSAWRANPFCELGTGDVDLDAFLRELDGYAGWLVVEQDWVAPPGGDGEAQIAAQARNLAWLAERA